tara:strand:+ start:3602 stop:3847 length:246 start_codon:yes stop_codon:yes gene_type:complete
MDIDKINKEIKEIAVKQVSAYDNSKITKPFLEDVIEYNGYYVRVTFKRTKDNALKFINHTYNEIFENEIFEKMYKIKKDGY